MKLVELGHVARPHGLSGEVRVRLHWEGGETLLSTERVFVGPEGAECRVLAVASARPTPRGVLLRLEGVVDRDGAEALRGARISVPRDALPEPGPDEYYLCDLVGAEVRGPGGVVGEVSEVRAHPTVDTIVVTAPDGRLLEQPLCEPWIDRVDLENGRIELTSNEGLIE